MLKKFFVPLGALAGMAFAAFILIAAAVSGALWALGPATETQDVAFEHHSGSRSAPAKLLVVRVEGVILGEKSDAGATALLGGSMTSGYRLQEILDAAAKDPKIQGVLVQFATPGGTIHGARAVFDGIRAYKRKTTSDGKPGGKPVIAHVEGLSASGGVYAMVGADEILAEPGSLVGSIGVTMGAVLHYDDPVSVDAGLLGGGVTTRKGIRAYPLTAGKGKDFGNPYREPSEEELTVLRAGLRTEYADFVAHVASARKMDPTVIVDTMGAYVFGTSEAIRFGLIDATATRREALTRLADRAGIADDYEVVRPEKSTGGLLHTLLAAARGPSVGSAAALAEGCRSTISQIMAYHGEIHALCR